jgi:hypothetical protein
MLREGDGVQTSYNRFFADQTKRTKPIDDGRMTYRTTETNLSWFFYLPTLGGPVGVPVFFYGQNFVPVFFDLPTLPIRNLLVDITMALLDT